MAHNVYINIILTTEMEEIPLHEHGIPAQIRKQVRDIVGKDNNFKIRRCRFDIIDDEIDFDDMEEDFDTG